MIRKLIFMGLILLSASGMAYAGDYFTPWYNLRVPEEATRDWNAKISNDIISIDVFTHYISEDVAKLSQDACFVSRDVWHVSRHDLSVDLQGYACISADVIRLHGRTTSPDVVTLLGPLLTVSKDTNGLVYLNFWDGTRWRGVSLSS